MLGQLDFECVVLARLGVLEGDLGGGVEIRFRRLLPDQRFSASKARHGFVATPPSASRAARMTPSLISRATAADARANSKLARSRTFT